MHTAHSLPCCRQSCGRRAVPRPGPPHAFPTTEAPAIDRGQTSGSGNAAQLAKANIYPYIRVGPVENETRVEIGVKVSIRI